MIDRKLTGQPPRLSLPRGTVDTQTHLFLPGFPAEDGGPGLPLDPLPTPEMYKQVMAWLGIDRVVVTQANAHQAQNASLLACLDQMGDLARGVAVITGSETEKEIEALSAKGIVGARIMDLPGGATGLEALADVDATAHAANWMMAVQFDGSTLPDRLDQLSSLKSRWVLDHHAKIFEGATQAHLDAIKRLLDGGNMWFKFAGCYESSREGGPEFSDIAKVAKAVVEYAPERVIWGTNWPHNLAQKTEDYPDDGALLDTVLSWVPDTALQQVLVDNPQELYGFPTWAEEGRA
ncbi:amidohydrolase family protein [Epibacterium sp. SM1979]|uniref:Amidohydrolase family protein n=1 Tax=Tritonibacter litoralis TaxID=2662264 RepID=A0A843YCT3_9RHOB|nr:amidohydrolase family protein [Tritonibacter litoralis]MQQ07475.1 amidohydrolase family protein [Tritonibacter litoralis]